MPGRQFNSNQYRYGFQNQEKDDEIYGEGNAVSFEYRINDTRLGRFLSTDPLESSFPWNSPYAFSENRVTNSIELEGLEAHDLYGPSSHNVDHNAGVSGPQTDAAPVGTVYGPYKSTAWAADAALSGKAEVYAAGVTVSDFKSTGTITQGHLTAGQIWDMTSQLHAPNSVNFGRPLYEFANGLYRWKRWVVNRDLTDLAGKNHGVNSAINNSLFQTVSLAAGPLAGELKALQATEATFYTIQSEADAARLMSGGTPWPSGPTRAHLGTGVYAWGTEAEATAYLTKISSTQVSANLRVVQLQINTNNLSQLRSFIVPLEDDAANIWLQTHSSLFGEGAAHGFQYIQRSTGMGTEHYFSSDVFNLFKVKNP